MSAMTTQALEFLGLLVYASIDSYLISTQLRQYLSYRLQGQFFIATYLIAFYGKDFKTILCTFQEFRHRIKTACSYQVYFLLMHAVMGIIVSDNAWFSYQILVAHLPLEFYIFLLMHLFVQLNMYYGFMCFNYYCLEIIQTIQTTPILREEYEHVLRQLETLNTQLLNEMNKRKNYKKPLTFNVTHTECIICHEQTIEGGAVELPCTHHYCSSCILQWFWTKKEFQCPYCKQ